MPLSERSADLNAAIKMDNKRKKTGAVDLTQDSDGDDAPLAKVLKGARDINARRHGDDAPAYSMSPSGSMPSASQRAGRYGSGFGGYIPTSSMPETPQHTEEERTSWLADEMDDFSQIIGSTQAAAAQTEYYHFYGDLDTKIVGCRFYKGHANPGEQILVRREPRNPYDSNAIRIDNVGANQIGHIPKGVAAKLSKCLDGSYLHVEGELSGRIGEFDCPLLVHMYGPDPQSLQGRQLVEQMKQRKLPLTALKAAEQREKEREKERKEKEKRCKQQEKANLAEARRAAAAGGSGNGPRLPSGSQNGFVNPGQAGLGDGQPLMEDILKASQRFNPREVANSTDKYGMREDTLKNMPSMEKPKGIKTEMLPYQLQALTWLLDQEDPQLPPADSGNAVQLWKKEKSLYTNIATNYSIGQTPLLASGGILADDMGLGKTLEMIALLAADNERAGRKTGTTLIVSPLSVMSNWHGQILSHVHEKMGMKVYTYHAGGRVHMNAQDFAKYDVVITTYQTLASDYIPSGKSVPSAQQRESKARPYGLFSMEWRRIILDEGHSVRNPASKGAAAVTALHARSRWVLTGTPIVNSLKDLYCLLRFIGITGGLENLEMFNRVLVRPLKQGDQSATFLLQAIMTAFTLRRRKEMSFVDLRLPKLDEFVHRIDFTAKERERYDALEAEAKGQLEQYKAKSAQQGKGAGQAFQSLLEILLRMRQCCNHWQLCPERVTNLLAQLEGQKTVALTPENQKALQDMLQVHIESQEECPVCIEPLHTPVITACGHFFGLDCISKVIEAQHKCPICRAELPDETSLVSPAYDCGDEAAEDDLDLAQSSSKLESMMQILSATKKTQGDKTIVFSQWTKFLDIVQARLDNGGYKYCRIDGTMPAQKRDAALQALESDPECTVMLASLGVCAVGLNLTAANQIILSDTWWAPAVEDQAVDRVHRLGQKKETRVFRLVVDRTVEESTLEVQKEKRKLMSLAFAEGEGKRKKAQSGRLADIQKLLGEGAAKEDEGGKDGAQSG